MSKKFMSTTHSTIDPNAYTDPAEAKDLTPGVTVDLDEDHPDTQRLLATGRIAVSESVVPTKNKTEKK